MRTFGRLTGVLALLVAVSLLMTGCAGPSVWERSYQGTPALTDADARQQAVPSIRDVSWDRLQQTRAELDADVAASDTHPDDWPADKRALAKAKLLKGLQIQGDPADIDVLGRSEFSTTTEMRADDGGLATFGQKLGATRIIYATKILGKADKIVDEPVTTYIDSYDWHRDRDGRHRYYPTTRAETTWVPVVVRANEHAWVAYFLRERGNAQR